MLATTQYRDADGDGFGNRACSAVACPGARGLVADGNDCDDTRPGIVPGSVTCGGNADEVIVCEDGAWTASTCGGSQLCEAQANGTGICQ